MGIPSTGKLRKYFRETQWSLINTQLAFVFKTCYSFSTWLIHFYALSTKQHKHTLQFCMNWGKQLPIFRAVDKNWAHNNQWNINSYTISIKGIVRLLGLQILLILQHLWLLEIAMSIKIKIELKQRFIVES